MTVKSTDIIIGDERVVKVRFEKFNFPQRPMVSRR
jgi:hypothetical protein